MKPLMMSFLGLLALCSCKKEEVDALPEATQEGKGTAGCLVDGKAWTPEWKVLYVTGSAFSTNWYRTGAGKSLYLSLRRVNERVKQPDNSTVRFFLPYIRRPGTFELNDYADPMLTSSNPPYGQYIDYEQSPYLQCLTSPLATGTLTITRFDTVARVVAGTFELHPAASSGQVVHITEGRFDLPLEVQ